MPVGSVLPPTTRRVQRTMKEILGQTAGVAASERAGDPNSPYFPPRVAEIAYVLAKELGIARASLREPGVQRTVQSAIQRVINALAAQEKDGTTSASEALRNDALGALANDRGLAAEILKHLRGSDVRSRILGRVKNLLSQPTPYYFSYLKRLEQQGLRMELLPDGGAGPFVPTNWPARAEVCPSPAKEALILVLREAEDAISVPWKICPLCARPYPRVKGNTAKACPPCRRRHKPLKVHRRLARAPKDPVFFRVMPADAPEHICLVIATGTGAPSSLRRMLRGKRQQQDRL